MSRPRLQVAVISRHRARAGRAGSIFVEFDPDRADRRRAGAADGSPSIDIRGLRLAGEATEDVELRHLIASESPVVGPGLEFRARRRGTVFWRCGWPMSCRWTSRHRRCSSVSSTQPRAAESRAAAVRRHSRDAARFAAGLDRARGRRPRAHRSWVEQPSDRGHALRQHQTVKTYVRTAYRRIGAESIPSGHLGDAPRAWGRDGGARRERVRHERCRRVSTHQH